MNGSALRVERIQWGQFEYESECEQCHRGGVVHGVSEVEH